MKSPLSLNVTIGTSANFTSALFSICDSEALEVEVTSALRDSVPVLLKMAAEYGESSIFAGWPKDDSAPLLTTGCVTILSLLSFFIDSGLV
jgi:hypothetical protein